MQSTVLHLACEGGHLKTVSLLSCLLKVLMLQLETKTAGTALIWPLQTSTGNISTMHTDCNYMFDGKAIEKFTVVAIYRKGGGLM